MDFFTVRSLLHTGCCSLLPTAPVVLTQQAYWILPHSVDPALSSLVHMHACLCSRERRQVQRMTSSSDDVGSCSASGASSFTCAYCQASPAALVASPSSGVPLSPLDQSIWSNIHGDINFQSIGLSCFYSSMLFDTSIDLRSILRRLHGRAKCEVDLKQFTVGNTVLYHGLYLALLFCT